MKDIEFEVNGEMKKLRFDFNALADLETQVGMGVAKLFSEDMIGFQTLRLLFWAGLRHENSRLTLNGAGDILKQMIDEGYTFNDLSDLISKALQASGLFGEEKEAPFVKTGSEKASPSKSKNSKK